jgi:hypothetical protein
MGTMDWGLGAGKTGKDSGRKIRLRQAHVNRVAW